MAAVKDRPQIDVLIPERPIFEKLLCRVVRCFSPVWWGAVPDSAAAAMYSAQRCCTRTAEPPQNSTESQEKLSFLCCEVHVFLYSVRI